MVVRGTGSKKRNSSRPAINPPTWASHATEASVNADDKELMPKIKLNTNQIARNATTREFCRAVLSETAGIL